RNGNGIGSNGFAFHSSSFPEGLSANRPPYLTGDNYPLWKLRMQSFLIGHNM
ncbi:DUF4219 domain-containing protein, partial [Escherichia coli]|nr:DUF4219 domain-containing protein [Escherichia coli]